MEEVADEEAQEEGEGEVDVAPEEAVGVRGGRAGVGGDDLGVPITSTDGRRAVGYFSSRRG